MAIESKRSFELFMTEEGESSVEALDLNELLDHREMANEYEYKYAAQDITDKILDLKEGESMYFQPNRDNKNSKGIIVRTS